MDQNIKLFMSIITKATLNDVAALTLLVNTAYRGPESQKGWATEAHLIDGQRVDQDMITEYINDANATLLKYTNDDGVLEACVYLEEKDEKLYLGMLSVFPRLQAKGLGRKLLLAAEEFARSSHKKIITMTVITSRHELISWYERRGYKRTGEILPFHAEEKFGIPKAHIELEVLEKRVD
jgi:ribosomal protein S18 acetylase RimI-like enzyme